MAPNPIDVITATTVVTVTISPSSCRVASSA
jgi:hypothetical protein